MNLSFEHKVALVTGAASGLGLATARAFAESGASVAESFLHQKQEGLCNVMSFADAPHGQTLAHAFIELLPF